MGEISKYNISIIKSQKSDFSNERNNFVSSTYNTFLSSYICTNGDSVVQTMSDRLKEEYKNINEKYNAIVKWWENYINDIEALENVLSRNGNVGRNGRK